MKWNSARFIVAAGNLPLGKRSDATGELSKRLGLPKILCQGDLPDLNGTRKHSRHIRNAYLVQSLTCIPRNSDLAILCFGAATHQEHLLLAEVLVLVNEYSNFI